VQVDPIKPTLIAPGSKRLKLDDDKLLSNFAFNFNLRRYNEGDEETLDLVRSTGAIVLSRGLTLVHFSAQPEPFLSLGYIEITRRVPQKVLTSSRKVESTSVSPLVPGDVLKKLIPDLNRSPIMAFNEARGMVGRCRLTR